MTNNDLIVATPHIELTIESQSYSYPKLANTQVTASIVSEFFTSACGELVTSNLFTSEGCQEKNIVM